MKHDNKPIYKPSITAKGAIVLLCYMAVLFGFWMWFRWFPMWTWRLTQYNAWDNPFVMPPIPFWMTAVNYGSLVLLVVGVIFIIYRFADKEAQ